MRHALAIVGILVGAAALISVVLRLTIDVTRKQWNALNPKSIILGVSSALLAATTMLIAACGDSATTTPAQSPTPTPTFDELSQTAKRVPWEELYRNNETYVDELVYLKGEVIQVIADGNNDRYQLRVAVAKSGRGYSSDEVVFCALRRT